MAAATGEVALDKVPAPFRPIGGFVATGETWSKGWLLMRNAAGLLALATAAAGLLPGGFADRTLEDAPASDADTKANAEIGIYSVPMLSTSAFAASDGPLPAYAHNNREIAKSNSGRSVCGLFLCLDPNRPTTHALVWVGPDGAAIGKALEALIVAPTRGARGVVVSNVADLAVFTVAATDLTFEEGDRVLLAAQSTAAQCGIYVVGEVTAGVAALTRAPDMPAGARLPLGCVVEIAEGTTYGKSTWKATASTSGGWVVGTNDPVFMPKTYKQKVTLASGTYTIGVGSTATPDEPLFLLAGATVALSRAATGGTVTSTIQYNAPASTRVTGKAGTAVLVILATVAAGTINTADNSDVDVTATNW